MQLLFLLLLLLVPYLTLSLLGRWFPKLQIRPPLRGRVGLSIFFAFTAVGHFIRTEQMAAMLPPSTPYRVELIYLTGLFELLGAIAIWIPALTKITGVCLMLMMILVLPANIYSAISRVDFGGHAAGPVYLLLRIPFQLFVIWWIYFSSEQGWLGRRENESLRRNKSAMTPH